LQDVVAYAAKNSKETSTLQLQTSFPKRVLEEGKLLAECGFGRQEALIVSRK
jgi:hypothetical protein